MLDRRGSLFTSNAVRGMRGGCRQRLPVQLFATDLNSTCVAKARAGVYPASIEQHVSPERLKRFFFKEEAGYRISKDIRERCIFSRTMCLRTRLLAGRSDIVPELADLHGACAPATSHRLAALCAEARWTPLARQVRDRGRLTGLVRR